MLRKYLLSCFAIGFTMVACAQNHAVKAFPKATHLQAAPYNKTHGFPESVVPEIQNPNLFTPTGAHDRNSEELVGVTRWDAEGYACIPSRVYNNLNGEPVATWTFATDPAEAFPERGTGYSARTGGSWSPSTARIESTRTGFPSASILSDGTEVVVTHATGFNPYRLLFLRRAAGQTAWTETFLDLPPGFGCLWPHLAVGGADGKTVHVIAITTPDGTGGGTWAPYEGENGHILYWRSTDGGLNWDKKYQIIPGLDSTKFSGHGADEYTIDAHENTVGIAVFPSWNDILLFKSSNNGQDWDKTTVRDFPDALENYAGLTGQVYTIDDVGTPDPNSPDTSGLAILTSDNYGSLLIDDLDQAHIWFGRMYVIDTDPAAGSSYYPGMNGLMYWKESFGTDNFQTITGALDYDGDGAISIASINAIAPYYNSLSSFPCTGIGADGAIYLGYAALHELYPSTNDNAQFFRHVYLMKSTDYGESWGEPIDLITGPFLSDSTLIPFLECVYPMLPRHMTDKVWLVYQQDYEPGIHLVGPTSAGNHPFTDNNLLYIALSPNDIPGTTGTNAPNSPTPPLVLSLSPNPATSLTQLSVTLSGGSPAKVEVFGLLGNRVMQNTLPNSSGSQTVAFPVDRLEAGAYWVRVTEGSRSGMAKLMVAH